jgi:hypothetical protein
MKSKLCLFIFALVATPLVTMAGSGEGFTPLIGIPGLENTNSFDSYVDALYALAISIAALVAVVKIVLAGAKYMMDDIVTHKSEAKEDIKNALIGLLIIIGAVIILNTINSDLTNLSINAERAFTDQTLPSDQGMDRIASLFDEAADRNTQVQRITCSSFLNPNANFSTCENVCRNVYRGVMDYDGINECFYIQADADQCDPTQTADCCENVKRGDWVNNSCSGLTEATDNRIAECTLANRIWDEELDTCTTRPTPPPGASNRRAFPNANTLRNTIVPGTPPTASQIEVLNQECSFAFGSGWEFDTSTTECVNN